MQQTELLCHKLHHLSVYAGGVAARPVEASDKTHCDRVAADSEHDRNGRGRGLAASDAGVLAGVAITATRRRIRSAAKSGSRSYCPAAQRNSIATF